MSWFAATLRLVAGEERQPPAGYAVVSTIRKRASPRIIRA
jgi:hypothetical protein